MKYKIIVGSLLVASISLAQSNPKTAVFNFQKLGVDTTTVEVATTIFVSELNSTGKFNVVQSHEVCSTPECACSLAKILKAEKAIISGLSKLGEKIVVNTSLVDVATGKIEFNDNITAKNLDDLDVVLKRLAMGLAEKKKFEATAEVEAITEMETQEPKRKKTFYSFGAMVGYMIPLGSSYGSPSDLMFTYNGLAIYEMPNVAVLSSTGFSTGKDAGDFHIDFSFVKLLSKKDFSPYIGGGLGMHWINCNTYDEEYGYYDYESNDGIAISLDGGIMALRLWDIRGIVNVKYSIVFAEVADVGYHQGITITFGIAYNQKDKKSCCMGF